MFFRADYLQSDIADRIQINTKIIRIDHSKKNQIVATASNGNHYRCDVLLISVPLGLLKTKDIHFTPALPKAKEDAIHRLGFGVGIKVILKFSEKWWDETLFSIHGGDICPEYLASQNYAAPTLTGFIMGDRVQRVVDKSAAELGKLLCKELDLIFRQQAAQRTLITAYAKNWAQEPYCKGAYSFTTLDSVGTRQTLSQPLDNRLYFIGEACNTNGHGASLQGAMESAELAVERIKAIYSGGC